MCSRDKQESLNNIFFRNCLTCKSKLRYWITNSWRTYTNYEYLYTLNLILYRIQIFIANKIHLELRLYIILGRYLKFKGYVRLIKVIIFSYSWMPNVYNYIYILFYFINNFIFIYIYIYLFLSMLNELILCKFVEEIALQNWQYKFNSY